MGKHDEAIAKFIEKMNYLQKEKVLGIVFYGSFQTGYDDEYSDIDLHIIMDSSVKEIIRGVSLIDGFSRPIEYFEKPIDDLYLSVENDFKRQSNALLPIIGNGTILFDRYGDTKKLQEYIKEKFTQPLPPLSGDDAKEMICIIDNRMVNLKKVCYKNPSRFNHLYHLNVEKIRKFYTRLCGCPEIPVSKVHEIYTDKDYGESFSKGKIPDEKFIEIYFETLNCESSSEEKLYQITKLFNFSKRNLNVDTKKYRIKIKSRNDLHNLNH